MTKSHQVYKCEICGNIVEILHPGFGELVCCGEEMALYEENTVDAAQEKHVPVIARTPDGVKVSVGSAVHPMDDGHYIEWIQLIAGERSYRRFLRPGEKPEAVFQVTGEVTARAYCNLHGLWKS